MTTAQANPVACETRSIPPASAAKGPSRPPALEASFEDDFRAIATYVQRRTGDADLAREIASETYVHAMMSRERWVDIGLPVRCWLLRIATRRLAHHRRRERRRFMRLACLWKRHEVLGRKPIEQDEAEHMRRAIATLAPAQQDVLVLHHVEGLSVEQVGSVLEIPIGTVKSRLGRGREALVRAIEVERGARSEP